MYNTHKKLNYIYIGVDTHKNTHTATVINCFNDKLETLTFNNDKIGYNALLTMVKKYEVDNLQAIYGLEDTRHLGYGLATFLLSKNCIVKNVNSNLTYNERKKHPIIDKTDDLDSSCIAKVLLDELDNLTNVSNNEIYWTLKQLVKMRKAIVKNNIEYKNKLHSQLLHHYPNYNNIFTSIYGNTALEVWERYPSPNLILEENFEDFATFINKASGERLGSKKANQIIDFIKEYDIKNTTYQEERNSIIKMLVKQIKDNNKRLKEIEVELLTVYNKTNKLLHTYPCVDKITSAYILSEVGDINRFSNSSKLARYCGIAPVNRSSGSKDKEIRSEFGNRDLNNLIYSLACRSLSTGKNNETPYNSIFLEYYHKKISQGKTKHQAIICIMRRMINIIYGLLKTDTPYQHPTSLANECKNIFLEKKQELELKQKKKLDIKKKYEKVS